MHHKTLPVSPLRTKISNLTIISVRTTPLPAPGVRQNISSMPALALLSCTKMGRIAPPQYSNAARKVSAYFHRRLLLRRFQLPMHHARVNLARARDLLLRILDHLIPLGQPSGCTRDGEQHGEHVGEHVGLKAHGLVDDS